MNGIRINIEDYNMEIKEEINKLIETYMSNYYDNNFIPGKTQIGVGFPFFDHNEIISALDSLLNLRISQGKKVNNFEIDFSKYVGSDEGIAVNSGSSANLLSIAALVKSGKVPLGSEVIVPAATFTTVISPIIQNGLIPVFVDVEPDTYNIDPITIAAAINENTGLIMPVHSLGCPADMKSIMEIANENNIPVFEDCCEAHGAAIDGQIVGSFGIISAYSFFVAHNMTSGEGGMIMTSDSELDRISRSMREFGRLRTHDPKLPRFSYTDDKLTNYDERYVFEIQGYNVRMSDIHASLGIEQLKKLDKLNNIRVETANYFNAKLEKYEEFIQLPKSPEGFFHSYYGYTIVVKDNAPFSRTEMVRFLEDSMIETRAFMGGNLSLQPAYRDDNFRISGSLDVTNNLMDNAFFIGCHPMINKEAKRYVIEIIDNFFSKFQ